MLQAGSHRNNLVWMCISYEKQGEAAYEIHYTVNVKHALRDKAVQS